MEEEYTPIAVIGYGCLYPPSMTDSKSMWNEILDGEKGVRTITDSQWDVDKYYSPNHDEEDKTYCKKTGYIDKLPEMSELLKKFGIEKEDFNNLNRTQKMMLYTILKAMEMSNFTKNDLSKIPFVVGNMLGDESFSNYVLMNRASEFIQDKQSEKFSKELAKELDQNNVSLFNTFPSNLLKGVQKILGFSDDSFVIDGACSGSLLAIDEAIKLIHHGDAKITCVTGVLGNIGVTGNVSFSKIGALSQSDARPLDYRANGLVPGEGSGTIFLERLDEAEKNNRSILGVIKGSGVTSDGSGQAIYAPSIDGQYRAMKKSLSRANLTINDIDYVEMHATGTPVGDKVEIQSVLKLCKEGNRLAPLMIGSIKNQIGHSFSAAGMANLFVVLESFAHNILPPTHGFSEFPEELREKIGKNLVVNTKKHSWGNSKAKTALINAFGFGGINANILIQEYISNASQSNTNIVPTNEYKKYSIVGKGAWLNKKDPFLNDKNISYIHKFPFLDFKIPPAVIKKIDEAQQVGLIAAKKAINDADKELKNVDKQRVGIYVGCMMGLKTAYQCDLRIRRKEYEDVLRKMGTTEIQLKQLSNKFKSKFEGLSEDSLPGFMDNVIAGRIANSLNIKGVNAVVDSGQDSFLSAIKQGTRSLDLGIYDAVVVGAINANDLPEFTKLYKKLNPKVTTIKKGAFFFVLKRQDKVKNKATIDYETLDNLALNKELDYLGASSAYDLYRKLSEQNNNEEKYKVAFFNTRNVQRCIDQVYENKNINSIISTAQLAILYKNRKELIQKLKSLKEIEGYKEKW
ncbi:beta-ketoacyl synthase N-terminal-like domain-containing protein [Limosilactobacillus reuteri]|nr:beta-ketoacyl synthase N-terminal-like domain-containing protein [Limosilactobacillus reuteri]